MTLLFVAALAAATPTAAPDIGAMLEMCRKDMAAKHIGVSGVLTVLMDEANVAPADRDGVRLFCAVREDGAMQERAMLAAKRPKS